MKSSSQILNLSSEIAVLLPCHNEAITIGKVVADFKAALPGAQIYVFDNCSTDKTTEVARAAGATVIYSPHKGKGNVVRHMFQSVEAKYYIMADGDDTYPAELSIPLLQTLIDDSMDMVVGTRLSQFEGMAFRRFHQLGNHLVAGIISSLFKNHIVDVLSGFRAFSRDFVKTIPLFSEGFQIETEMTIQSLSKGYKVKEIPIHYRQRPAGSFSKLNTFSDGALVLKSIFIIFKDFRPLVFYSAFGFIFALLSLLAGIQPILDYVQHQYVYKVPLAILAAALGILSLGAFASGLILDTISKYHRENFQLLKRLNLRQK